MERTLTASFTSPESVPVVSGLYIGFEVSAGFEGVSILAIFLY